MEHFCGRLCLSRRRHRFFMRVLRCALLSAQPFSYVYYMGGNRLSAETVEIQSWNGSASSVELDCSDANRFNLSLD